MLSNRTMNIIAIVGLLLFTLVVGGIWVHNQRADDGCTELVQTTPDNQVKIICGESP